MARIAMQVPDLFFASKVDAMLRAAGHEVIAVEDSAAADAEDADAIVADLGSVAPEALTETRVPVLGFYRHTDVELRARADESGLACVVPRSRVARELPELLASLID
jgi:hypothetical protein